MDNNAMVIHHETDNEKLTTMKDLSVLRKLPPLSISLTPEEVLTVREFIALNFPEYIHEIKLDDVRYIASVCCVFNKFCDALSSIGVNYQTDYE